MKYRILYGILVLAFLTGIVGAVDEGHYYQVSHLNVTAARERYIVQVNINNLNSPSNTTLALDASGQLYHINFNLTGDVWRTGELGVQFPNGTWITKTVSTLAGPGLISKNELTVQFYYVDITSSFLSVKWNMGFRPFYFTASRLYYPPGMEWTAFKSAVVDSTVLFDSTMFQVTPEEFQTISENNAVSQLLSNLGNIFEWTWDGFLFLISKIPVVGETFSTLLELWGITVVTLLWFLEFLIVENFVGTVLIIEFICIAEGIANSKGGLDTLKRTVHNNIMAISGLIVILTIMVSITGQFVDIITSIISSVKPGG